MEHATESSTPRDTATDGNEEDIEPVRSQDIFEEPAKMPVIPKKVSKLSSVFKVPKEQVANKPSTSIESNVVPSTSAVSPTASLKGKGKGKNRCQPVVNASSTQIQLWDAQERIHVLEVFLQNNPVIIKLQNFRHLKSGYMCSFIFKK